MTAAASRPPPAGNAGSPPLRTPKPPPSGPRVVSVDDRRTRRAATQDARRLTSREADTLSYLWHGYESDLGCRSVHGAIEDRLRRSPPKALAGAIVDALRLGGGRCELGKLLRLLRVEQAATRHEVLGAIGGMVSRRRLAIDGVGERALRWMVDGDLDRVDEAMRGTALSVVRLLPAEARPGDTREARWRAQDEELERGWRECAVSGGEDWTAAEAHIATSAIEKARGPQRALVAIGPEHARALRDVYGPRLPWARYDIWGDVAPLAVGTATVRRLAVGWTPHGVIRELLDGAGGSPERRAARAEFVRAVQGEAESMLFAATAAYREAMR